MPAPRETLTDRLALRAITANDHGDLARMHADETVMRTLGGTWPPERTPELIETTVAHWNEHGFGLWVARERSTGAFVGRGGLRRVVIDDRDEVEVAYALVRPFWGRGLATELARESVRFGFEEVALPDLVCFTLVDNDGSRRVMEKVGFVYERDMTWKELPHVLYRLRNPG